MSSLFHSDASMFHGGARVIAALSFVASACAIGVPNTTRAAIVPPGVTLAAKQELVRNIGSEVETLDPQLVQSVGADNVASDLFEGVTNLDHDGVVQPGVAEKWEQKDATTWIFHLRKNAKWSNGQNVTANDFVYGIQRLVDPKLASEYASTFGGFVLNGNEIIAGKKPLNALGVRAIDANTLEVKTPFPVLFLPEIMSRVNFAPAYRPAVEKFGRDWTKPANIVTNGAYTLKDWQVNSKIVLTKNASYWDGVNVPLTKVTYLPIEDENTDVKMFQSGENDYTYQLPTGTYEKYRKQFPNDMRNSLILGTRYYGFNNRDALLKDVRVRKAISMVIDRDILAQRVTADGQTPLYGLLPKGVKGADVTNYEWSTWPMNKRIDEAKKLLEQAGVKPGTKVRFSYNTSDYNKKMALFVASELKTKLGLVMEIEAMEFKVLLKKRHEGDYQISRNGWVGDYNDATTFLALVRCNSDQNDNFNCNQNAEALIKEANQSTDQVKRTALQTQASKMIMDDYPMLPLLQYGLPRLVKSYVGGYSLKNPTDHYISKDFYIIKH